jgi:hypothetical protein
LVGRIDGGPTPDEHGYVSFKVTVGDEDMVGLASPCGVGCRGEVRPGNLATVNAAMKAVRDFVKAHEHEMPGLYREAARLRRDKGNPSPAGNTRRGLFELVGQPTRAADSVRFTARSAWAKVEVLIFRGGGFIDHCDDWQAVSDADRDEALTIALDYVFAHAEEATGFGLDVGLLEELWR